MEQQPARKDRSATILLRISGVFYVLSGVVLLLFTYGLMIGHPAIPGNPTGVVIVAISISVLGLAMILLRRWAVALLSAGTVAFMLYVAFAVTYHHFPGGLFLGIFYVALGSIPAVCAYFAWPDLK
jgi:succinate dehydrogenase hydrophobic anchor subunit